MHPNASYLIPYTVRTGDKMTAEVTYAGDDAFSLTLTDTTRGWTFASTQAAPGALRQSAEWIVEAPWLGRVLPLANFGTVTLTGASANGNNISK